jgi:hypothetical protein
MEPSLEGVPVAATQAFRLSIMINNNMTEIVYVFMS